MMTPDEQKTMPDVEVVGVELAPELVEAETRSEVQGVFDNAAVQAARTIAAVAAGDSSVQEIGKPRLDAARYVVDRVLGGVPKAEGVAQDPWKKLMKALKKEPKGSPENLIEGEPPEGE